MATILAKHLGHQRLLVGGGEGAETVREGVAGLALLGVEPVHEDAQGQQGSRPAGGLRQLAGEAPQVGGLHLTVLVDAEHVLQLLQRPHHGLDDAPRPQPAEQLQQVAQLLAPLAQLVQVPGRAGGVDRGTHRQHPPVDLADPAAGDVDDGSLGVRALAGRSQVTDQECPVGVPRLPVGGASQLPPEGPDRRGAVPDQQRPHGRQGRVAFDRDGRDQVVPVQQLDVEVTGGARDRLNPAEGVSLRGQRFGREGALELPQHRAAAPHRHAQVVEELGVDVGERPRQVGFDHPGQVAENRHRRPVGALVGAQVDANLGPDPLRISTHGGDGLVGEADRGVDQTTLRSPPDRRRDLAQRLRVAEDAADVHAGRERHRPPSPPPTSAAGVASETRATVLSSVLSTRTSWAPTLTSANGSSARVSTIGASRSRIAPAGRSRKR